MDIRNFFSPSNGTAKKPGVQNFTNLTNKRDEKKNQKLSKKRNLAILDSDSDEDPFPSKKVSVGKGEKSNSTSKSDVNNSSKPSKKRKLVILDSDSDEEPLPSHKTRTENLPVKKPLRNDVVTKKSPEKLKPNLAVLQKYKAEKKVLKPVSSKDFFSVSPPATTKLNKNIDNNIGVDIIDEDSREDFNQTLKQLDKKKIVKVPPNDFIDDTSSSSPNIVLVDSGECLSKLELKKTSIQEDCKKENRLLTGAKREAIELSNEKEKSKNAKKSDLEIEKEKPKDSKKFVNSKSNDLERVDRKPMKFEKGDSSENDVVEAEKSPTNIKNELIKTPKRKVEEQSSSLQEKDCSEVTPKEKLAQNSANYRNYLHRQGPQSLGSKEIPAGEDNCLHGLTFLVTGVLESLEREEVKEIAAKYGGKVMATLSKNTSYMIVGRDAGPAKLEKAEKLGTKFLNEDEFLELIRTRKGVKVKSKASTNKSLNVTTKSPVVNKALDITAVREVSKTPSTSSKKADVLPSLSSTTLSTSNTSSSETSNLMWVDKYKPVSIKQVIGQQGDRSCAKKLLDWLKNWHKNQSGDKKRPQGKWNGKEDGSIFKAALLSGPPGVGKTTTATLACKETGYEFIELNASDTRSKKCLQSEISQVLQNKTISGSMMKDKVTQKHAIIFDEVDGMSGNEDRGGTQELIALIKHSKIPVICICNDRAHPKIRSLSNYCYDLRFFRPRVEQIKAGIMSLLHKEKIKVPPTTLHEIITATNQDLRQILHHLSFLSSKSMTGNSELKAATKDIKLSPFDVLKKVFSTEEAKSTLNEKSSLFFHDYSLAPLFVFENYPAVKPASARGNANKHLELLSEAADSISYGDIIDRTLRSQNNWSLLPTQAMFSSVFPGETMRGYLSQMIAFPSWLGKNSSKNHMDRVLQQIHMHTRLRVSANKTELGLDYLPQLRHKLTQPLIDNGAEGVKDVLETMEGYYLLREDLDTVVELTLWPPHKDPMSKIEPKVKAALTRSFNKECFKNPYATISIKKGKKGSTGTSVDEDVDDDGIEGESEEEEMSVDAMIKQKKSAKVVKEIEVTSKGKGKGRGKSTGRGRGKLVC